MSGMTTMSIMTTSMMTAVTVANAMPDAIM